MGSMLASQPSLIQEPDTPTNAPPWGKKPTPLVLIHDGGGTIFSYYCLGDLGRPVHGIANPRYETGRPWAGGIPEMARAYLPLVRAAVPRGGDVLLGGWSLGGLVSLELARLLADEPPAPGGGGGGAPLAVVGIVMVDSICPVVPAPPALPVVQHVVQWGEHTRQETKDKVARCFADAARMVREWALPEWDGPGQQEKGRDGLPASRSPPPVVLLRAVEPVPVVETGVSRVDIHRSDTQLGWGDYRRDLVRRVIDVPGHHYNLFHTDNNIDSTTEGIRQACAELEGLAR